MSDIVDAIDALVDEQLAAGPRDDYNVNRFDKCPHCGRQWHGLAITERIADMYGIGIYDETYSAATDSSRILCRGSDFIGPMPDERRYDTVGWTTYDTVRWTTAFPRVRWFPSYREHFASPDERRWWRLARIPDGAHVQSLLTFGRHLYEVTLTVGERRQHWSAAYLNIDRTEGTESLTGSIDVLAEFAPDIGGVWEPLTAPGVNTHPEHPEIYDGNFRLLGGVYLPGERNGE